MSTPPALLDPTPPEDQQARVDAVFGMAEEMLGFVPAGMRLYGVSPPLLETFAGTVGYFRSGTALSPRLAKLPTAQSPGILRIDRCQQPVVCSSLF